MIAEDHKGLVECAPGEKSSGAELFEQSLLRCVKDVSLVLNFHRFRVGIVIRSTHTVHF